MNLNEIKGDTEEDVFNSLNKIRRIIRLCANMSKPSQQLKELTKKNIKLMEIDLENLLYWSMRSKKIENIYNTIKEDIKSINW